MPEAETTTVETTETTEAPETEATDDPAAELDRVRKALKDANRDAERNRKRLKEFEDRDKTELEKLTEKATAAEQRAADLEKANLRSKVALAKGLAGDKAELADLLQGEDEEGMSAHADRLLALFSPGKPTGDAGGGNRGAPATAGDSMDDLIRQAAGRS